MGYGLVPPSMEVASKACLRVLVVDDDGQSARALGKVVTRHGCELVGVARTATDAVGLAAAERPDVAIVEVALAGDMDGIDTARLLRDRFGVSIVFVALHGAASVRQRACAVDPEAYLLKPLREAELGTLLDRLSARLAEGDDGELSPLRAEATRVLVVDDEYRVRFSIASTLAAVRCEVRQAGSAEAALEVLSRDREFDLVLCDMMMPQMTGAELFDRLLHEHPRLARRFAFVSAGATNSFDEAVMRAKGVRLLLKPFTPEDLLAFVGEQLSRAAE
jgi:CheY-like chemotaxis protein